MLTGKKRVLLLNKADLADPAATSAWLNYFRAQGIDAAPYSASTGKAKDALAVIDRAAKEAVERAAQKGIRKTVKAMVVGVPNVGKSTFTNKLHGGNIAKTGDRPQSAVQDALSAALKMQGVFRDAASGQEQHWQAQRTFLGLFLFIGIGFLAGLFGMGAGWANVPVLNLVMGAPLKVSAGTSSFILSLVDSSAAWVYLNRGAVLAIIAVPSVVGMMLGAKIGARLLTRLKAASVRRMVIVLLLFTGLRSLLKGLAIWA